MRARLYYGTIDGSKRLVRPDGDSWLDTTTCLMFARREVTDVRGPLVVLDLGHTPLPEDRLGRSEAQLLVSTLRESADEFFEPNAAYLNRKVADQIEEQIKPPRPPEPKGLGAVVKDRKGKRYSRHTTGTLAPWIAEDPADKDRPYRYYSDLDVPDESHILSEGVGS